MMKNVTNIDQRKPSALVLELEDEVVLDMARIHISALTHILVEPKERSVELYNNDVAALLWPLTEILNATKNRGSQA